MRFGSLDLFRKIELPPIPANLQLRYQEFKKRRSYRKLDEFLSFYQQQFVLIAMFHLLNFVYMLTLEELFKVVFIPVVAIFFSKLEKFKNGRFFYSFPQTMQWITVSVIMVNKISTGDAAVDPL